jgi:hypothetical protein
MAVLPEDHTISVFFQPGSTVREAVDELNRIAETAYCDA